MVRINCFCHPFPEQTCTCVFLLCQTLPVKDGKRTVLRDVFKLRTDKYLQQSCRNSPGAHKQVFAFAASALTINLISDLTLLQSTPEPASGLMGRVLVEGCRRTYGSRAASHIRSVSVLCLEFPAYETETTACLDALTGPHGVRARKHGMHVRALQAQAVYAQR